MNNYLLRRNTNSAFDLLDDAFNSFFKPVFYEEKRTAMKTDIKDTEHAYVMDIEMAGYDKKDIELSLEKGYLTVSATKKQAEEQNENYIRRERTFSTSRTYYVGDVKKEGIKAKYENGILQVEIPKKEKEIESSQKITIE